MIVDLNNNTIIMKTMDCQPFDIDFHCAQNTIPTSDLSPATLRVNAHYQSIIDNIKQRKSFLAAPCSASANGMVHRGITFDTMLDNLSPPTHSHAVHSLTATQTILNDDLINGALQGNNTSLK
jgi:hypothetical protein